MGPWRSVAIGLSLLVALAVTIEAQDTGSLDAILSMTSEELQTGQAKLTWLGPQNEPIPTVVFTIHGRKVNWQAFRPWQREEHHNDEIYEHSSGLPGSGDEPSFTVSPDEFQGFLRSLKHVLTGAPKDPERLWYSITIVAGQPEHPTGFEGRLDQYWAEEFFVYLRGALHADPKDISLVEGKVNRQAMSTLQWWGCALGLLSEDIPAKDVTADVRVTTGGLRWNPDAQRFECKVTVTNTSQQPIQGPIALVVDLSDNASVMNTYGITCVTTPIGRDFINLPMPTLVLEPGEALEIVLEFEHSQGEPIQFTTKVLAGPGER